MHLCLLTINFSHCRDPLGRKRNRATSGSDQGNGRNAV